MQNQNEIEKINRFLSMVSPVIAGHVKMLLRSTGAKVQERGRGPDLVFSIKTGEKEIKFFLRNLLLEIATADRDEVPLRFDERLRDFDYFLSKMTRLTQSKMKVLFRLLMEKDVDVAIDSITKDVKKYARIRIWRFDQKKSSRTHRHR